MHQYSKQPTMKRRLKVQLNAKLVRRVLAKKNLSQNWLASRIGASSGYMSQMMSGVRNPSPQMRETILQVLKDYGFDDLFKIRD